MDIVSFQIGLETKKRLNQLKIHPREPYNDVIKRLLDHYEKEEGEKYPTIIFKCPAGVI